MKRTVFLGVLVTLLFGGCEINVESSDSFTDDDSIAVEGDVTFPEDSVSFDTESTSDDDSGKSSECIPTLPEGTLVKCEGWYDTYKVQWDMKTCTASIWDLSEDPPPIAKNVPPDILLNGSEEYGLVCVPIDE